MNHRTALGRHGEDAAIAALREAGYIVVARNVRLPGGEIDAICRDGDTIVFVEVKTRDSHRFGSALAAVDRNKRRTLRALAADWLQIAAPRAQARFDIVTVDNGRAVIYRGAFT